MEQNQRHEEEVEEENKCKELCEEHCFEEEGEEPWYVTPIVIILTLLAFIGLINVLVGLSNWFISDTSNDLDPYEVATESEREVDLYEMDSDISDLEKNLTLKMRPLTQSLTNSL